MALEIPRIRGKQLEPYGDKSIIGTCRCGARWVGANLCHCSVCHLTFMSLGGFDKHRVGRVDATRCRTPDELIALRMAPDEAGHWRLPPPKNPIPGRRTSTDG